MTFIILCTYFAPIFSNLAPNLFLFSIKTAAPNSDLKLTNNNVPKFAPRSLELESWLLTHQRMGDRALSQSSRFKGMHRNVNLSDHFEYKNSKINF